MNPGPVPTGAVPERPDAWLPGPSRIQFAPVPYHDDAGKMVEGWYEVIVDTGSTRVVTIWPRDALEKMLRTGLDVIGVLPDGLVLATPDDLSNLRPPEAP